ncbi:MAG: hypothetical protein ACE5IJ_10000 [Thermoplasmata archaeon]
MSGLRKWMVLLLVALAILSASLQGAASEVGIFGGEISGFDDQNSGINPHHDDADEGSRSDDDEGGDDERVGSDADHSGPSDDEGDEDDESELEADESDDFEREEREVKIEIEGEEVTIKLESRNAERKDEIKVHFDAREGRMKVSFETEAAREEEVEMRITFRRLVEFIDSNGDGAFSPLDDDVIQSFLVEELSLIELNQAPFSRDGVEGRKISVLYALPGPEDATFGLIFWVFGSFTFVNGIPVAPTEAKIDILINNFPFEEEGSGVAMDLVVKTEFEVETSQELDDIMARGEEYAAFFQWSSSATVDGDTVPVESQVVRVEVEAEEEEDGGEFEKKVRLFLSYPQGMEIVHDPKVGIMAIVIPANGKSFTVYTIGLATALLLVLGVWAINRRRR